MKTYKPTTPSRRNMSGINYRDVITADKPVKALTKGYKRSVGRNAFGRITTRHKGSGHKKLFRDVDFKLDKFDIAGKVASVEYDPNRSGFIGLINYMDGERRYMLLPQTVTVGSEIITSETALITPGNRTALKNIQVGTFVYNVEIKPKGGAKLARSAGNYAEVVAKDSGYVDIKMPSSEVRKVSEECFASIGQVSNEEHHLVKLGKAGRNRWKGVRPTVRGTAQNPVDHPHGGGEGRQGRGRRRAISVYGKPTGKGQKTRTPKKYSNKLIVKRRKVGKKR